MTVEIKSRRSGEIICSDDTLLAAVKNNLQNLTGAYLRGADLRGANLRVADLTGADLRGAMLAWQSHDLLSEILKRAASDDIAKLKVAGLILICREKCWQDFTKMRDPLAGWALGVLREWIVDGDDHPECLDTAEAKTEATMK